MDELLIGNEVILAIKLQIRVKGTIYEASLDAERLNLKLSHRKR